MLEGFRFGSSQQPPPPPSSQPPSTTEAAATCDVAASEEVIDAARGDDVNDGDQEEEDYEENESWHVSESIDGEVGSDTHAGDGEDEGTSRRLGVDVKEEGGVKPEVMHAVVVDRSRGAGDAAGVYAGGTTAGCRNDDDDDNEQDAHHDNNHVGGGGGGGAGGDDDATGTGKRKVNEGAVEMRGGGSDLGVEGGGGVGGGGGGGGSAKRFKQEKKAGTSSAAAAAAAAEGSGAAARETYRDAVDAERAALATAAAASTSSIQGRGRGRPTNPLLANAAAAAKSRSFFFLPRHHSTRAPSLPPPPPERWNEVLDAIRTARASRTASVDDFHAFLLSLRDAPDPHVQALGATLLSVQCRDSVALVAMRRLQAALGGAATLAAVRSADISAIEEAVSCCNYKRTKARYVKEAADELHLRFKGAVPHTAAGLQRLPGVGPKIAHLVASVAFGLDRSGVVVDTHVRRLSERLGWTTGRACVTAEATRVRLEGWLPAELWAETTLLLVGFGQAG